MIYSKIFRKNTNVTHQSSHTTDLVKFSGPYLYTQLGQCASMFTQCCLTHLDVAVVEFLTCVGSHGFLDAIAEPLCQLS